MLTRITGIALAAIITASTVGTVEAHHSGAPSGSKCPQHYGAAIAAGWTPNEWRKLDSIMWRESRCKATAVNNNRRTRDASRGLVQLNLLAHRSWIGPLVGWNFDNLYHPETNLRVARALYEKCGWGPWTRPYWCRRP